MMLKESFNTMHLATFFVLIGVVVAQPMVATEVDEDKIVIDINLKLSLDASINENINSTSDARSLSNRSLKKNLCTKIEMYFKHTSA